MPAGDPPSIVEVATGLRAAIYSGRYPAGAQLPTRHQLAEEHGISAESAGLALRKLRDDGLVLLRQGGGTFVLERDLYRVALRVRYTGTERTWRKAWAELGRAVKRAAAGNPAVDQPEVEVATGLGALITMTVSVAADRIDAALGISVAVVGQAVSSPWRSPHWAEVGPVPAEPDR